MNSQQLKQLYNIKLQKMINDKRKAEVEAEQAKKDAYLKHTKNWNTVINTASLLNVAKDARDSMMVKKVGATYHDEDTLTYDRYDNPIPQKKYQERVGASILDKIFRPYEETEGYKEYQERLKPLQDPKEKFKVEALQWQNREEARNIVPMEIAEETDFFNEEITVEDTDFTEFEEWESPPQTFVAPEVSEDDPMFQFMKEGWEAGANQAGQEAAPMLASAGTMTDSDSGMVKKTGDYAGRTFKTLQDVQQMYNIGQTMTNEEATDADKAVAGVQGVKLLADISARRAGQETASQIGKRAAGRYLAGEGLEQGVKLGTRQAVGTAVGGLTGGYTAYTEGKAAAESWEEGDYDEAVLQGLGSIGGGMQTIGAGMMITGVGSPVGALLYGLGTAAQTVSSVGQVIESIFENRDTDDKSQPDVSKLAKKQFLERLRSSSSYQYGR